MQDVADGKRILYGGELRRLVDDRAVDLQDDVAGADALGQRVRALGHGGDIQSAVLGHLVRPLLARLVRDHADRDADGGPSDDDAFLDDDVDDFHHRGGGDREADALDAGVGGHHLHIGDADHLAVHVQQRAAGVAFVDGGVRLQQVHAVALVVDAALDGGDDAAGQRETEFLTQRVADGGHAVADLQRGAVAEDGGRETLRFDLQHSDVADGIRADELRLADAVVRKRHGRAVAVRDHVGVRQDEAVLREDDAGAPVIAALAVHIAGDRDDALRAAAVQLLQAQLLAAGDDAAFKVFRQRGLFDVDGRAAVLGHRIEILEKIAEIVGHRVVVIVPGDDELAEVGIVRVLLLARLDDLRLRVLVREQQGRAGDQPDHDQHRDHGLEPGAVFPCGFFLRRLAALQRGVPAVVVCGVPVAHSITFFFICLIPRAAA